MLSSPPPAAVTAPPSAKASAEVRATLIETSPAAEGLTETARSARPARVLYNQTYRPTQSQRRGQKGDDAVEAVALTENEDRLRQVGIVQYIAPPKTATMIPMKMKLMPNVARMLSTSSLPWLLARRTSGKISTR